MEWVYHGETEIYIADRLGSLVSMRDKCAFLIFLDFLKLYG